MYFRLTAALTGRKKWRAFLLCKNRDAFDDPCVGHGYVFISLTFSKSLIIASLSLKLFKLPGHLDSQCKC